MCIVHQSYFEESNCLLLTRVGEKFFQDDFQALQNSLFLRVSNLRNLDGLRKDGNRFLAGIRVLFPPQQSISAQ